MLTHRIDQDQSLVYYYRPNPKDAGCSDPVGKPAGFEFDDDSIFVTAIVSAAGTVQVQSVNFSYAWRDTEQLSWPGLAQIRILPMFQQGSRQSQFPWVSGAKRSPSRIPTGQLL